jgi:hypothetical protein
MSIDTARRRTRTNMFTSMCIRIHQHADPHEHRARGHRHDHEHPKHALKPHDHVTIYMIFIRMIIGTTRPDAQFRREASDRGGDRKFALRSPADGLVPPGILV